MPAPPDKPMERAIPTGPFQYISDSIRFNTDISGYVYVYDDNDVDQVFYEDVLCFPPAITEVMGDYFYFDDFGQQVFVAYKGFWPPPELLPS